MNLRAAIVCQFFAPAMANVNIVQPTSCTGIQMCGRNLGVSFSAKNARRDLAYTLSMTVDGI